MNGEWKIEQELALPYINTLIYIACIVFRQFDFRFSAQRINRSDSSFGCLIRLLWLWFPLIFFHRILTHKERFSWVSVCAFCGPPSGAANHTLYDMLQNKKQISFSTKFIRFNQLSSCFSFILCKCNHVINKNEKYIAQHILISFFFSFSSLYIR